MIKFVKLADVCLVRRGTTITRKQTKKGNVPVIAGGRKATYFHNEHNRESDTITVSGSGASAGLVNYWSIPIFASDCSTVELKDNKQNIKFIYYYMQSMQEFIYKDMRSGTAQPHVYAKDIANLNFPLFSLEEQQRIVAKLEAAYAEIDKIEISLKKNKDEINNFFDSYVLKYFKKNITNKEIKLLKDVCENYRNDIVDGPFGSNLKSKDFTDKGIPVLKIQNVKEYLINNKKMVYVSKTKFEKLKRHSFKKGDIVMTKLGEPLGVSAIIENLESGLIVADLIRIRANKINTEFLCFQLNSSENRKYINSMQKGTTRARITLSVIRELPIYCPDENKQEKILKKIKSIKSDIAKLKKNYLQKENNLKSLKSSLLNNFLFKNNAA